MPSSYDFQQDYEIWKNYALQAHSRNFQKKDVYISLQTIVENVGHKRIVEAACDRSRVLEIGVGGGEHIEFEKKIGLNDYTAVDIEPLFLNLIKEHYPEVKTIQVEDSHLPFANDHFTTAIAASTLEHIPSLEETLIEVRRVLTNGGDFLVLVPRNGSFLLELFKTFITYPTLRRQGVRRPKLIWNYENANSFLRIRTLLTKHFEIKNEAPVPFTHLPEWMSPLHFFHCSNTRNSLGGK